MLQTASGHGFAVSSSESRIPGYPANPRQLFFSLLLLLLQFLVTAPHLLAQHAFKYDTTLYNKMQWREIGPLRAGRSIAVAGHKDQPLTYYFGATGGGVWKSEDGGITWIS